MAEYDDYFSFFFIFELGLWLCLVGYIVRQLFRGVFNPSPYARLCPCQNCIPHHNAQTQTQPQPQQPQPQTQRPLLTPEPATVGQPQPQFQAGGQLPTRSRAPLIPTRPRPLLIPSGQAPRGQIPQPPWRGPKFRPVAGPVERAPVAGALRIREAQRNAAARAAAPTAAATRPAAAPQGTQVHAGTAQTNGGTAVPVAAPVAPVPAASEPAVADSRIREPDLIQPLLFVGFNVGSPVESVWNTDANGFFGGGRPMMFGRGMQIGNNDGNNNNGNNNNDNGDGGDGNGNGNGNGTTPPPPPPPPPPAAAPQDENNNGTIPEPEGQTMIGDPNGFWLRGRTIDPEDAGVNFDTPWNPLDEVHVTNNPNVDDGDDVVMMNVDDEIERQLQARFTVRWFCGGFTQEEMYRYSQGEALSGTTSVITATFQTRFDRWKREFQAGLTGAGDADAGRGDAPLGYRAV